MIYKRAVGERGASHDDDDDDDDDDDGVSWEDVNGVNHTFFKDTHDDDDDDDGMIKIIPW